MGEWSKKIGEYGEDVAEKFFSVIGWNNMRSGISIPCINANNEHLNEKGTPCKTHGVDKLFSYDSPLIDGHINNVLVSVKYQTCKYPNSPTAKFKGFMQNLLYQLECFEYSEEKNSLTEGMQCNNIKDIGVLFWLNSDEESNDDLISVISSARIDYCGDKTIYIMDNKRVAFILDVMKFIKTKSAEYDYNFIYPPTGQNINPINRDDSGKILPVEYINSRIIPIKLQSKSNNKEISIFIGVLDDFEADGFMRIMGLSKELSASFAGQVIIAYNNYKQLQHEEIVNNAKLKFRESEYAKRVVVINFNDPLNAF